MNQLLAANFLSSLGTFLSIPVLSLYLESHFQLQPSSIGAIGAIWPAMVFGSSFFSGSLIDRFGFRFSIRSGLLLCIVGFLIAYVAPTPAVFAIGMAFFGLGKAFFDCSIRTGIAGVCPEEKRARIFRARYLILNVASVLGPLIGAYLFPVLAGRIFAYTALAYGCALVLAATVSKNAVEKVVPTTSWSPKSAHRLLFADRSLMLWVVSGALIITVYGAFEAMMPLVAGNTSSNVPIFGYLMSINSGIVIVMQFLHLMSKTADRNIPVATLGFIGLILGFAVFGVESHSMTWLILGTVLYSVGESLLFPCYDIVLDQISTPENKASYFAVGEVKQVGFLLGSFVGGILYQTLGAPGLFFSSSLLCFLAYLAFQGCGKADLKASSYST